MTTRQEISEWFDNGVKQKASHLIVVCDTFSHEDYPVYVKNVEDAKTRISNSGNNMQHVMEVYNLKAEKDLQLDEHRAFNF